MSERAETKKHFKALLDRALDRPLPRLSPDQFIQTFLFQPTPEELKSFKTYRDVLVHQLVLKACRGTDSSIRELIDRTSGKAKQEAEGPSADRGATYTDFLLSLAEADQRKKYGIREETEEEKPETDVLKDLL